MPYELMGTVCIMGNCIVRCRVWNKSYIMFLRSIEWQRKLISFCWKYINSLSIRDPLSGKLAVPTSGRTLKKRI